MREVKDQTNEPEPSDSKPPFDIVQPSTQNPVITQYGTETIDRPTLRTESDVEQDESKTAAPEPTFDVESSSGSDSDPWTEV